ncbi:glycosyltransferase family 2 protein [Rhizobium tumorigenes]|uniref:glycosyltransferase family 2 protein n=1 Tax=Rhizobium tumorigenes TaxID=2041385 RepID=UPI00241F9F0D|nr:glycosyltransferase family 2 protein [Rhizobium tumorigenes]WFS01000.1 glycosyltransferase family 2 protein [Rhizobium tumorigenes]
MVRSVLVAIPTLNEAAHIEAVLDQLYVDLPDCKIQFVIADGGSTDGTVDVVRRLEKQRDHLSLVHNPQRLQSAGVNLVVRQFGQDKDVLVRCDAHASYPRGFLRSLVNSLQGVEADSVVVPMDSVGNGCLQRAVAWVSDSPIGSGGSAHRGGRQSRFVDHGHHAAMLMESFRRAGGYEETFSHNEDAEFDCRLRALGGKIYLDTDIRIEYQPRATFAKLARQYFNYGKGRSRTVRRHPTSFKIRQFAVPAFMSACAAAIVLSPLFPLLLMVPAFYVFVLAVTSVAIAFNKRSACGLLAGPAAFTMHASWALGFITGILTLRETQWQPDKAYRGLGEAV